MAVALAARANPTLLHSLSTLIDLAQRGFLSIIQLPGKLLTPNIFELVRIPSNQALSPHEQVLMDAIFTRGGEPVERVRLDQYTTRVGKRIGEFSKAVKLEIGMLGLISPARKNKQTHLLIGGTGLILVGLILGIIMLVAVLGGSTPLALSTDRLVNAVFGASIATFVGGLIYIIYASLFSPLTSQGRWIASQWNGFSAYLRDIIRQREEPIRPDAFFQFLPFATGFGLGAQWAKSFQKRGYLDVPVWFHALNAQDPAESFSAFTTFMASSNASASSSGGVAGGASGGGASGAG